MDRKFLKELKIEGLEGGLPASTIDEIMAEYGADFKEKTQQIDTLSTEKQGLEEQLKAANDKIKSFADVDIEKLNQEIADWETKYNTDTENLKNEIAKKEYDHKIEEVVKDLKFSSNGAKKAFVEDLKSKDLKFDENKLVGYEDFLKTYKEADPNAFVKEEEDKSFNLGGKHEGTPTNEVSSLAAALHQKFD